MERIIGSLLDSKLFTKYAALLLNFVRVTSRGGGEEVG